MNALFPELIGELIEVGRAGLNQLFRASLFVVGQGDGKAAVT